MYTETSTVHSHAQIPSPNMAKYRRKLITTDAVGKKDYEDDAYSVWKDSYTGILNSGVCTWNENGRHGMQGGIKITSDGVKRKSCVEDVTEGCTRGE